jgi:hypothetical protein
LDGGKKISPKGLDGGGREATGRERCSQTVKREDGPVDCGKKVFIPL